MPHGNLSIVSALTQGLLGADAGGQEAQVRPNRIVDGEWLLSPPCTRVESWFARGGWVSGGHGGVGS